MDDNVGTTWGIGIGQSVMGLIGVDGWVDTLLIRALGEGQDNFTFIAIPLGV